MSDLFVTEHPGSTLVSRSISTPIYKRNPSILSYYVRVSWTMSLSLVGRDICFRGGSYHFSSFFYDRLLLFHTFFFFSPLLLLSSRFVVWEKTEYPRPSFLIYIWLGSLERNGWRLVYRARVSSRDDRYVAGLSLGTDILISFTADVSRGLR